MLFSLQDIEAALGPAVLARGRLLAGAGGLQPVVQRDGELVTALIRQGGGRPTQVYVRVTPLPGGGVRIQGDCTCVQRHNCFHVAAVLLKALEWEQPGTIASRLPQRPGRAPVKAPAPVNAELPRLAYLLLPQPAAGGGVGVETYAVRKTGGDGYREMRRYAPAWVLRGEPPRFLSAEDLEILRHLAGKTDDERAPARLLEAELLARILATGRCHADSLRGRPLRRGAERPVRLAWQMDGFGNQLPEWRIRSRKLQLLQLDLPWYLDAGKGECGPLQAGLPQALVRELGRLPMVTPDRATQVRNSLRQRFPDTEFPLPQALQLKDLPAVPPRPWLLLDTLQPEGAQPVDLACLSFEYHGRRLGRAEPGCRVEGRRVLQFQRDGSAERVCLARMEALGFQPQPDWNGHSGSDCFTLAAGREGWYRFQIEELGELLKAGWKVEYGDAFRFRLAQARDWQAELEPAGSDWFSLGIGVETDAGRVDLLPALVRLIQAGGLPGAQERDGNLLIPLADGRLLPLPTQRLRPILQTLFELYDPDALERDGRLRLSRIQLARLAELDEQDQTGRLAWRGAEALREVGERLRRVAALEPVAPPAGLAAALRDYQQQGLEWLQFLRREELAGILADDMGLGKTVQTLAHLLLEKEQGRLELPALVVAPTSLMPNWRREAQRFTPDLRVLTLHGPGRHELFGRIAEHDLVLTTYPLLARDREPLLEQEFHLLVLDEAQVIKNPRAQAGRVVRELHARHRLCLTGTPMENHLGELWSLFDFLLPGLLGTHRQFARRIRRPIEREGDQELAVRLARRVRPFLLRRTKAQVTAELPPKTEILRNVELEGGQRDLYESIRLAMHQRVRREVERKGLGRSSIVILDSLLKLRQVCCDPRLVKLESARGVRESAKLELLRELLPEMVEEGRRILLFSQFTEMLGLIEREVRELGLGYEKLTGSTRDRAAPVDRFQSGAVPLFLISLKAGGVGLNLTAADTVIHYDPWWNPAVERQATDRAHRIGQDKPVFVYKLLSEGTVEERIQALQARKQALADALYDADGSSVPRWSEGDVDYLFEPLG